MRAPMPRGAEDSDDEAHAQLNDCGEALASRARGGPSSPRAGLPALQVPRPMPEVQGSMHHLLHFISSMCAWVGVEAHVDLSGFRRFKLIKRELVQQHRDCRITGLSSASEW